MCGIVGILPKQAGQESSLRGMVQVMQNCIVYRGPDDAGIYSTDEVVLGHRRLAILDVTAAGHQPMLTPDGTCALVFNGEIYNYRELQEKYLADVHLVSSSDTEVLLHLLQRQGLDILLELRGMFAFAFWDGGKKELLLATDPFGKKPLYYIDTPEVFAFASEPKSLLSLPFMKREVAWAEYGRYLLHEYVPAPNTPWVAMKQLQMGQAMTVTAHGVDVKTWWRPTFLPKQTISFSAATKKFDQLLGQAVERRMVADVPVGLFLSGGIDSTTILWYMRQMKGENIHSCSVSFAEKTFNEAGHIDTAVSALGPVHHDVIFGPTEFLQAMDEVIPQLDIPFADASFLPTYVVSKLARQYMTVVLSGDGADEMLGGYGTFQAAQLASMVQGLPASAWELAGKMAELLPVSHRYFSFDFKLKSFLRGLPYPLVRRNQVWLGSFSDTEIQRLLAPAYRQAASEVFTAVDSLQAEISSLSLFDAVSQLTISHYLHDDILVKLDRATMLNSIEARTPFLDVDVAEFLLRLPDDYKKDKRILKNLMRGRIPHTIIDRPKKGFGIPLGTWFMGPLKPWLLDVLSESRVETAGVWEFSEVARLLAEHMQGKVDHRKKLWTLVMWQLWYEEWVLKGN